MAIQVLCPGCKKRFSVSEKFAGKKGPCPKCKAEITIPEASEDVKVHEPESFGPKGKTGRAALKPIFREESKFSPITAAVIGAPLLLALILAIVCRATETTGIVVLAVGAILVAPSLAYAGYIVFRSEDLEPYRGQQLWVRLGACSILFAGTWGLLALINVLGMGGSGFSMPMMMILLAGMLALGGGISYICLDLEYLNGAMHYGLYLVVTILLRWIVVGSALPLEQVTR